MNKKLLLSLLIACTVFKMSAMVTGVTISKRPAPLCNIMQIVVTLVAGDGVTYNGPALATITLPAGLTFIRSSGEEVGSATATGQVVTWLIPSGLEPASSRALTFYASADNPGQYTVTGQVVDDQGVPHVFDTPANVTLNFPHINNGVFAIAKNATLVATLLGKLDTTSPATTANTIRIQPNAQNGTALPVLSESPFVVTYIPSPDFVGYDFFTAQASDACTCTDSASMFVAVGVEGDPATSYATFLRNMYNPTPSSQNPVARNITLPSKNTGETATSNLLDYVDLTNASAPFVYTVGSASHGTPSIVNDTVLQYIAETVGVDTFTYTVTDNLDHTGIGTVQITVTEIT